jgi:hypothetical protein
MNLLPKKSWHVGKRENLERVFRDELEARIIEERAVQKKHSRDKEERLQQLRRPLDIRRGSSGTLGPDPLACDVASNVAEDVPMANVSTERFELFGEYEKARIFGTEAPRKTETEKLRAKYRASMRTLTFSDVLKGDRPFDPCSLKNYTKDNVAAPGRQKESRLKVFGRSLEREDPLALMPKKRRV